MSWICAAAAFSLTWYCQHDAGISWAAGDMSELLFSTLDSFRTELPLNNLSLRLGVAISNRKWWMVNLYS